MLWTVLLLGNNPELWTSDDTLDLWLSENAPKIWLPPNFTELWLLENIPAELWLLGNTPAEPSLLGNNSAELCLLENAPEELWLLENAPVELWLVENAPPELWLLENVPPELWLLGNNPKLHEVAELPAAIGVNPVFSWNDFISLFLVSGFVFFSAVWDPAAGKFSPLPPLALSQLTTSVNFSWNKKANNENLQQFFIYFLFNIT